MAVGLEAATLRRITDLPGKEEFRPLPAFAAAISQGNAMGSRSLGWSVADMSRPVWGKFVRPAITAFSRAHKVVKFLHFRVTVAVHNS